MRASPANSSQIDAFGRRQFLGERRGEDPRTRSCEHADPVEYRTHITRCNSLRTDMNSDAVAIFTDQTARAQQPVPRTLVWRELQPAAGLRQAAEKLPLEPVPHTGRSVNDTEGTTIEAGLAEGN